MQKVYPGMDENGKALLAKYCKPKTGWFSIVNDHNLALEKSVRSKLSNSVLNTQTTARSITSNPLTSSIFKSLSENPLFKSVYSQVYPVVWAKTTGYPFWPAKLMSINFNSKNSEIKATVRFFGEHDISQISLNSIFHASRETPHTNRSGKSRKAFDQAMAEMNEYVENIDAKYGGFFWYPSRTPIVLENLFALECITQGPKKALPQQVPRTVSPSEEILKKHAEKQAKESTKGSKGSSNKENIEPNSRDQSRGPGRPRNTSGQASSQAPVVEKKSEDPAAAPAPKRKINKTASLISRLKESGIKPDTLPSPVTAPADKTISGISGTSQDDQKQALDAAKALLKEGKRKNKVLKEKDKNWKDKQDQSNSQVNFLEKSQAEFKFEKRIEKESQSDVKKNSGSSKNSSSVKQSPIKIPSQITVEDNVTSIVVPQTSSKRKDTSSKSSSATKTSSSSQKERNELRSQKSKKSQIQIVETVLDSESSDEEYDIMFNMNKYQDLVMNSVRTCLKSMYSDAIGSNILKKKRKIEEKKGQASASSSKNSRNVNLASSTNNLQVAHSLKLEMERLSLKQEMEMAEMEWNHQLSLKEYKASCDLRIFEV